MKTLYLVRHAKSSWKEPFLEDSERPLNKRGKRDAPFMGKLMNKLGVNPDLIISSPAKRAFSTAKIIANEIGYPKKNIEVNESVYGVHEDVLLELISKFDDKLNSVMMFGHNPEFTSLLNSISNTEIDNLTTCSAVGIEFDINSWEDVTNAKGKLVLYEYPKKYIEKGEH